MGKSHKKTERKVMTLLTFSTHEWRSRTIVDLHRDTAPRLVLTFRWPSEDLFVNEKTKIFYRRSEEIGKEGTELEPSLRTSTSSAESWYFGVSSLEFRLSILGPKNRTIPWWCNRNIKERGLKKNTLY